jgi:hypothetical protein
VPANDLAEALPRGAECLLDDRWLRHPATVAVVVVVVAEAGAVASLRAL